MHSHDVTFTERSDFEFLPARFAQYLLKHNRRPRRRVFFLGVMTLEYLTGVLKAESWRSGRHRLKKQIHSDGKVGAIEKTSPRRQHLFAKARRMLMPTGGSDDHALAGTNTSLGIGCDSRRSREINYGIDIGEIVRCETTGVRVVQRTEDANMMASRVGDFRHQRACLDT